MFRLWTAAASRFFLDNFEMSERIGVERNGGGERLYRSSQVTVIARQVKNVVKTHYKIIKHSLLHYKTIMCSALIAPNRDCWKVNLPTASHYLSALEHWNSGTFLPTGCTPGSLIAATVSSCLSDLCCLVRWLVPCV